MKRIKILSYAVLVMCVAGLVTDCSGTIEKKEITSLISLQHLDYLNEHVVIDGIPMIITHIYSEYPDYQWVDAHGEGIACVDDVARSVLVYLMHYELFGDRGSLDKARKALNFVMYMEQEDGEFYNFISNDHTINTKGHTSRKSFSFWGVRGLRALCYGYKVFSTIDVTYADSLRRHIDRTFTPLKGFLKHYGNYSFAEGVKIPGWLVAEGGDATSEVVLALLDYWSIHPDPRVEEMIRMFAQALAEYQLGGPDRFPYGAHLSWKNYWHAWGNGQIQALARAGRVFEKREWIASAQMEADNFCIHCISRNFLSGFELVDGEKPHIEQFPQIAYGVRPMVSGLIELYVTTGDEKYAKLGGLAASWLGGNNIAGRAMYHPEKGRCYDGINSPVDINLNAGAESTIEALITLLTIAGNHTASQYYFYESAETKGNVRIYRNAEGERVAVGKDRLGKKINLFEGTSLKEVFESE